MKTILFFLLLSGYLFAQGYYYARSAAGGAAPDCTFYWACEADNEGAITGENPAGYTAGADDTPDFIVNNDLQVSDAQAFDGDSSLYFGEDAQFDKASFSINTSVCADDSGTFQLEFWFVTWEADDELLRIEAGQDNRYIYVATSGSDEMNLRWRDGNGSSNLTTTAANISTGSWYTIIAKWEVGGSPELSLTVEAHTVTSSPGIIAQPATFDSLQIGNGQWNIPEGYLDAVKIWNYVR